VTTAVVVPALVAFGLSALLTFVCRTIALRTGIISVPAADRWSAEPVALLGGPAMVAATTLTLGLVDGLPVEVWILLAGATSMAVVGLRDDLRPIGAATKLTAQVVAAAAVTSAGLRFPLTGIAILDTFVTMFWIVGLTNAFNLLDNMDGLAAGIAAIAGVAKMALFVLDGDLAAASASGVFAGACLGFLVHNLVPRRIFMGDGGSLFLGFFVAGLSTVGAMPGSRATVSVLIVPVVVMLVPIFDTVLVTVARVLMGRPVSQGGRDHASHRLVMAGLSERAAVFSLYALAAVSGTIAIFTRDMSFYSGLLLLLTLALVMLILGVSLARIAVYKHPPAARAAGVWLRVLPGATYMRQAANAAINAVLVCVSFYAAHAFRIGTSDALTDSALVVSLPVVFGAKMLALGVFGTYRSVWRYTDSRDLAAIVLASTAGSAAAILVLLFADRFAAAARPVFVLDWFLFTALLAGSRLSLRALSEMLRPGPSGAIRVLIYGAGDAGVALLQELRRNPRFNRSVVGFLDDDPMKQRTKIQGLKVLGGVDDIKRAIRVAAPQEIIIAMSAATDEQIALVRNVCEEAGVGVRRFDLSLSMSGVDARLDRVT
jgi:UDP-GlcNAc:undecaprenyl-phosphate GlcNAc-1-phosphate transferase